MSISLFDSINKSDLEKSKEIMTENVTNHDAELSTNLNLFKHLI
jgi:hypothetical protein